MGRAPEIPFFNLNVLADGLHAMAVEKGWYEEERTFGDFIALVHSELSEALEEYRDGHSIRLVRYQDDDVEGKPEGIPIELADVMIRILDFCGAHQIDIESAMQIKFKYNSTREHKHGGKVI